MTASLKAQNFFQVVSPIGDSEDSGGATADATMSNKQIPEKVCLDITF